MSSTFYERNKNYKGGVLNQPHKFEHHFNKEYWVPKIFRLVKGDEGTGSGKYVPEVNKKDAFATIEIEHLQVCPKCQHWFITKSDFTYNFDDQEKMWELIFEIKVKYNEKVRQSEGFIKFIRAKLQQAKFNLEEIKKPEV